MNTETAVGRSISFRPGSLYASAAEYGEQQKPQRNPSQVVCEALDFFLSAKGFIRSGDEKRNELLAAADEVGIDRAVELLRTAVRTEHAESISG